MMRRRLLHRGHRRRYLGESRCGGINMRSRMHNLAGLRRVEAKLAGHQVDAGGGNPKRGEVCE